MKIYAHLIKPILDWLVALIAFIILFPIFLIVLILLMLSNKGNAFFLQQRPGKDEVIFRIIKFKTMNDRTDESGELLPPDQRITAIGRFIRKYSLDEIPQLFNVLKGDMSIVGPRPLLPRYLGRYNDFQKQRHQVKPGITGWAQVNGRNAISWEEKFEYDVYYVKNLSLLFDLKILFLTVVKVLRSDGVYNSNNEIVPDFMGSEEIDQPN